jgi:hypothetical protein
VLAFALEAQPDPRWQRPRLVVMQDQAVDALLAGMLADKLRDRFDETILDVAVQRRGRRAVSAGAIEDLLAAVAVLVQLRHASERVVGRAMTVDSRSR